MFGIYYVPSADIYNLIVTGVLKESAHMDFSDPFEELIWFSRRVRTEILRLQ